jgi:hypothetical protein
VRHVIVPRSIRYTESNEDMNKMFEIYNDFRSMHNLGLEYKYSAGSEIGRNHLIFAAAPAGGAPPIDTNLPCKCKILERIMNNESYTER